MKSFEIIRSACARRAVACAAAGFMIFSSLSGFASVLGEQTSHKAVEYAQGTTYNKNTFLNDSVGQQTENFFEYVPNSDVVPIISGGNKIFGKRNVLEANDYLNEQGIFAAMGMNADFFSFQTGVPMSNTISDGHVMTADTEQTTGIGFNANGTAFVSPMQIKLTVDLGGGAYFDVECLNKYRQPYVMYMYTDEFGDYTNAEGSGTNVVLGSVSGQIKFGQPVTAVVESISDADGSVEIPDGKIVISVDNAVAPEVKARLSGLSVGQTVTIKAEELTGDARWTTAAYGTGCLGGTLIRNGQPDFVDESAAPRSAVGIKADGTVIFYTIDGRQPGHSYGVRKETLANRLLELGCVDAVNLDGGGSTQLGGTLPETTNFEILNSPSESLRSCANFIFLKKTNAPDGIPYKLFVYPYGDYVLSGSTVGIWAAAIDKSYGKATMTEPLSYYIESDSTGSGQTSINQDGYLTVYGDGHVYIGAYSGAAVGSTVIYSVSNPESVTVKNEADGSEVSNITVAPGESVNFTADSLYQGMNLTDVDTAYNWSVSDPGIGVISSDGTFTARYGGSGTITCSAGSASASVNVTVSGEASPGAVPTEEPNIYETDYPTITCSAGSDMFTAKIYGAQGNITEDNITFEIDGKKSQFTYFDETDTLQYTFPDGFVAAPHRIMISVTDAEGRSAYKTYTVGNISAAENPFDDTKGHWAENYISYMSSRKVISGYDEDGSLLFRPNRDMTRAEFACMIANYLGLNLYNYRGTELPYKDADDIPEWAMMSVQAMYSLGIMTGQQEANGVVFAPYSKIRRCEYAVAAARLMPDGLYRAPLSASDEREVPAWAKSSIEQLLTQGIMTGYPDATVKPNDNVTRAEAIKILFEIG